MKAIITFIAATMLPIANCLLLTAAVGDKPVRFLKPHRFGLNCLLRIAYCLLLLFGGLFLNSSADGQNIAAGDYHSLYLCSDNIPMSVGWNGAGQLGAGTFNLT